MAPLRNAIFLERQAGTGVGQSRDKHCHITSFIYRYFVTIRYKKINLKGFWSIPLQDLGLGDNHNKQIFRKGEIYIYIFIANTKGGDAQTYMGMDI